MKHFIGGKRAPTTTTTKCMQLEALVQTPYLPFCFILLFGLLLYSGPSINTFSKQDMTVSQPAATLLSPLAFPPPPRSPILDTSGISPPLHLSAPAPPPPPPPSPRQAFLPRYRETTVGPPYAPPPLAETLEGGKVRVLTPKVVPYACSSWAYTRIHSKVASILRGETDKPYQQGANDINDVLETIRATLDGASHVSEVGVREAVSSWAFAAIAAEAVDQGRRFTYKALDITKREGVEDLEAALWQCPGVDYGFTEGSDLLVPPWHTEVMLLDTWHTYKQLAKELPRWAPFVSSVLMLHDTSMYGERDEDSAGHGGREVNQTMFLDLAPKVGLWPAVEEFLASEEGSHWVLAQRITSGNGLAILVRTTPQETNSGH